MGACCGWIVRSPVLISCFRSFAASCKGVVTECEVHDVLKQVGLNKLLGLDDLPNEVYLRLLHMFMPILWDVFNHWLAQRTIPVSVTKGVITLLKKGDRHVWEGLDDYRPITLLNSELKILAPVLANCLQLVISDLIGPEQTYAVKGRSIQDNLHLIRDILEGLKDGTEAALINLDQSKTFDRVNHRFLASVLETARFKTEFRRWISMMYHNPQAVAQVNGRRSGAFAIEQSVRQGCPLSPLLYVLALKLLLLMLRDVGENPALRIVPLAALLTARVSAFVDDITVFVSRLLDIEAVKKAVAGNERIAGARVNFDKSEGLRLCAWTGSDTLPGPFRWNDELVPILGAWFGPDPQLERNWSEVHVKVNAQVETWLLRRLSLKGRRRCALCNIFPLILYRFLYFLCLGIVGWRYNNPSPDYSGEFGGRWSVDRNAFNVRAMGVWVCPIWRTTGSLKDSHTWVNPCRGTQCGDVRRVGLFFASSQTQRPKVDVGRWAKHRLSTNAVMFFVTFLGPVTFQSRKNCFGN